MAIFGKKNTSAPEAPKEAADTPSSVNSNRVRCLEHLQRVLAASGARRKGAVLKLYLENFKQLNDTFGYDYCEKLLEEISAYLRRAAGCEVYRYIGVEFILILEDASFAQANELAETILEQFSHVWKIGDTDCLCSVQIGLCAYPGVAASAEDMIKCLDRAVTEAAAHGPDQIAVYDSELDAKFARRQAIALSLKTALEKDEIEIRYRPTYCLPKKQFTRAEFYMRVFVKGVGLVGSAEFIPIAEDSGQIRAIQYYALEHVCSTIAELLAAGKEFESIALPVSPVLFLQEDFLDEVRRLKEQYHIPDGKLALEIRESVLTTAYLNINIVMQVLSDMGVELILNDFGSGYSGISSILELPVNVLKLERMFVWQLETNPRAGVVIDGLIHIAKNLGLKLIAEGVETENQIQKLASFGCEYEQGFYYAPTVEKSLLMQIFGSETADISDLITMEKAKMVPPTKR